MTYKVHVPGIMVQAKGLRGPKGDPGDITQASTYFQATSLMSNYADATHIHGSISGHNITATSGSNGLTLSVAALGAAANTLHAGDYVSMDVMGPSSTISITGLQSSGDYLTTAAGWDSVYQSAGAYLTTAAEVSHTHGDFTTINTAGSEVKYSSSSNGFTLAMPAFITTANETWHSHTDAMSISERANYFYTSNNTFANSTHIHGSVQTSPFAGSNVSVSSASSGITLSVPAFITTAPSLSHTHGNSTISGFNIAGTMLSNGLTLSVPNFVHLSNSTHFVNTTVSNSFVRSWELEGAHTAGTTGSLMGSILYLSGGDNITLSGNGNTIVISGNASGGTGGVAIGNTDSVGFSTGSVIFAGTNITVNTSVGTGASSNSQFINLSAAAPVTGAIAALGNTATSNAFGSGSVMFSGSNITVNLSSNGASQWIQLVGADPSAAANEVITTAGGYLSLSIDGVSTLISATGLQPSAGMSDYIKVGGLIFSNSNGFSFGTSGAGSSTTVTGNWGSNLYFQEQYSSNLQHMSLTSLSLGVGYSTHTHGSNISFGNTSNSTETAIRASSSSNGVTLVVPSYLTTAANSTHTHGGTAYTSNTNLYSPAITGGVGITSASSGWSISVPPYLTTAAQVSHSHGNPTLSLSNLSGATASASNGLTISITGYPASSFVNVSDSGNLYFVNSLGSNLTWGSTTSTGNVTYIGATAGGEVGTGFSSGSTSAGTEIKGTLNSNGLSLVYPAYLTTGGAGGGLGAFELSGNTSGSTTASGSTVQLYGGNNITLSGYDGSKIRIDGPTGNISFADSGGVTFGTVTSGSTNNTVVTASIDPVGGGAGSGTTIGTTSGTDLKMTLNATGLNISHPNWLTTYGGFYSSSQLTGYFAGTGFTTTATTGTAIVGTNDGLGLKLGIPAYITTGGAVGGDWLVSSIHSGSSILISTGLTNTMYQPSFVLNGVALDDGTNVILNGTARLSNANNVSFGISGATITASAGGGGPLVSYSGTIDVTNGYISVNTDGYHRINVGEANATDSGTHYFVYNNIDLYNNQLYNDKYIVDSTTPLATHSKGAVVIMPNGAHLGHYESIYYSTNPNSYSQNEANVALDISKGLHYGNFTGNNVSYSSGWSTYSNWIPNKKYVDDQISTVTAGGGGNWELEGTKTAGTTASAFDTLFLQGGNNITLSGNSNTIVFSVADAAGQSQQPMYFSGSNGESSASTITFGNLNNLSHYVSNGSVVGSFATSLRQYFYGNTATNGVFSQSATNIAFKGGSNITLSVGTDKQIEIIGPTQITNYAASDHTHSNLYIPLANSTQYATSVLSNTFAKTDFTYSHSHPYIGTNTSISSGYGGSTLAMSANTSGLTLSVPSWLTAASGAGAALQGSGTYTQNSGTIKFETGNGLTFGLTDNVMTGSYTVPSGSIVFSDGNGVTWGSSTDGATTTINATAAGGGVALGNTASSNAFTSGSVMLSGVNLTVNTSSTGASQYLQISAPAIGYLYFSNTNGHSWSSSTSGVSTSIYIIT